MATSAMAAPGAGASSRMAALDVLRGIAVAGMILVVSPGDWGAAYAQLQHAEWNGWTLADMVFPTFLFSVGVAIGLSFPRPWGASSDRRLFWQRASRRTCLLIVLGLALEATYNVVLLFNGSSRDQASLAHMRLPGILQRIGLCYLLATAIVIVTSRRDDDGCLVLRPRAIVAVGVAILLGYWAVLTFVPTPGFGPGRLDASGFLGGYIDRAVFTVPHLWPLGWAHAGGPVVYDPEGLLSTVPATVNVLFGCLVGGLWRRDAGHTALIVGVGGIGLILAGLALDPIFPINKRMWTSSFALFSGGFSAALLAILMWIERLRGSAVMVTPFRILGGNAILAFVISTLLGRLYDLPIVPSTDQWLPPRRWLDQQALALFTDVHVAATACAVVFVAIIVLILSPLHQRAFHFRL